MWLSINIINKQCIVLECRPMIDAMVTFSRFALTGFSNWKWYPLHWHCTGPRHFTWVLIYWRDLCLCSCSEGTMHYWQQVTGGRSWFQLCVHLCISVKFYLILSRNHFLAWKLQAKNIFYKNYFCYDPWLAKVSPTVHCDT